MADREKNTRLERRRTDPGHRVGAARSQDLGNHNAASDGQIRPQSTRCVVQADGLTSPQIDHARMPDRNAVAVGLCRRTGERDRCRLLRPKTQPTQEDLDTGCALVVADEPIAKPERSPVRRTGNPDTRAKMTYPSEVLDQAQRPGVEYLQTVHRCSSFTKRTRLPG